MPRIPPQHSSMPASIARRAVATRSSYVCVVQMRREDLAARLEVVVVAVHTRGRQARGLVGRQETERARDLEAGLGVHEVDGVDDLAQQSLFRAAYRDHDAELRGARITRRARGREDFVEVEERVDVDLGVEACRLRAERAVFGARARLRVDQALELDLGTAVLEAHAVRERDEVGELVERLLRDGQHLGAA